MDRKVLVTTFEAQPKPRGMLFPKISGRWWCECVRTFEQEIPNNSINIHLNGLADSSISQLTHRMPQPCCTNRFMCFLGLGHFEVAFGCLHRVYLNWKRSAPCQWSFQYRGRRFTEWESRRPGIDEGRSSALCLRARHERVKKELWDYFHSVREASLGALLLATVI